MDITLTDVAERAGVSIATASRALRGDTRISKDCIERVIAAAKAAEYKPVRRRIRKPNPVSLENRSVLMLLLGMARSLETLPVVAAAIHGTEAAVTSAGGRMAIADLPDVSAFPKILDDDAVDALVIKGALQGPLSKSIHPKLIERMRALPSVWLLGCPAGITWGDSVMANDFEIGRIAADYLIDHGHTTLGIINPKPGHLLFGRRQASFAWYAKDRGATVVDFSSEHLENWSLPLEAATDVSAVQKLVEKLLKSSPRPTAIFAPADSVAALIYRALSASDLKVGHDISVISCNNERLIRDGLFPELTTIDVFASECGERAVAHLATSLSAPADRKRVEILVQPELAEGSSVAFL